MGSEPTNGERALERAVRKSVYEKRDNDKPLVEADLLADVLHSRHPEHPFEHRRLDETRTDRVDTHLRVADLAGFGWKFLRT